MYKVVAVVVTYNGAKWVDKCIGSLVKSTIAVEVIVVDNGSTDNTKELITNYASVVFIEAKENLGFGKANNKGLIKAIESGADYVFLLNQDAWVEPNTIETLIAVAKENSSFGVISPVHLNGTYSGLDLNFSKQLSPEYCPSFYSDLYVNKPKPLYEIKFVNAAAWLINGGCINKTGLFEPIFFLYGEDNNYLQRVKYHGYKVGVTPLCTICHDREIRQGSFSDSRLSLYERTQSLITLLNILDSYSKSIMIFLKDRFIQFVKGILQREKTGVKYSAKEILYFLFNVNRLRKIRVFHKQPGNINNE